MQQDGRTVLLPMVALLAAAALSPLVVQAQSGSGWMALGDGMAHPQEVYVYSLAIAPNGDLFAGGVFTEAGGNTDAHSLARWDGTQWTSIISGFTGGESVNDIAFAPNGDLWVGGNFIGAGGVGVAQYIARWDGVTWHAINTLGGFGDLNDQVTALAVAANGDLYVGGNFTNAGGVANADRIARWDGAAWHAMGTGIAEDGVTSITVANNGDVYVGGFYNTVNGSFDAARASRWDGSTWHALGSGFTSGDVSGLTPAAGGGVYLAGGFTEVAGTTGANNIAYFDGTTWSALGNGLGEPGFRNLFSVAQAPSGDVYAGGHMISGDAGLDINGIGRWDGSAWNALGSGLAQNTEFGVPGAAGHVYAIAVGDEYVYAGGAFSHTADSSVVLNGVGAFPLPPATSVETPAQLGQLAVAVWPQPASEEATLALTIEEATPVSVTLFDALGRNLETVHDGWLPTGEHTLELPVASRPAGLYFVRVAAADQIAVQSLVKGR